MALQHSIENARAEKIGADGIAKAALDAALRASEAALDWVRAAHDSGKLRQRLPAQARTAGAENDDIGRACAQPRRYALDLV